MVVVLIAVPFTRFNFWVYINNMSQRLGMADGRCFTVNSSAQLFNNYVMKQNGISFEDNYSYRKLLQSQGPQLLTKVQENVQGKGPCIKCDNPLVDTSKIY